jgi:DNA-directed RNA polymerase sigma subunit (sigma70/sigma32)
MVPAMKIDIDLKAGFLQSLKREVLATLSPEERAIIEVSTGEMGNKPDAVKLGWLKLRTKETWTKQRYTRALAQTMKKLRAELEAQSGKKE